MRYNKTFKKYRDECRPEVLVSVREYVAASNSLTLHEDDSILKATGSREAIDEMVAALIEQHKTLYNETEEEPDSSDD